MRCLVLGGTGFIGRHLVVALVDSGHEVRVLSRSAGRAASVPGVTCISADFRDRRALREAHDGIEIAYHLIGTSLPSNPDAPGDVEGNVLGSLGVLDAAREARVRRVVFVSSGGTVYGDPRRLPIAESHPTDPICAYGITKLAIEKFLHAYERLHGLDYRVVRLSNPYGPGQRADRAQGAVAVFFDRLMRKVPIEIWGDGEVIRDYVFVRDTVKAMTGAAAHQGNARVFNVGSGAGVSLKSLLNEIAAVLECEPQVHYRPARTFDVPANILDISLARQELGWRPETSLQQGLRLTANWLRERVPVEG